MSDEAKQIQSWLKKIETAEKNYKPYHDLITEIRKYYKNESNKNEQNIFWSSIETLKPFLYFKQPRPYVERKDRKANPIQATACRILERALSWDLDQFDFDGVIKYVRNDYLLSGCGIAYEKYRPTFKNVSRETISVLPDGTEVKQVEKAEILASEQVDTVYIDPTDFIVDSDKVGIWEDVTWVARKIKMTSQEVIDQFGEIAKKLAPVQNLENPEKSVEVYEIYDKLSKKIYYLSKDYTQKFLKVVNPLNTDGFFPMPKPILTTTTNNSLIPVPDYSEIKPMLKELDGITSRMRLVMQAIKVTGCYDSSFPELANILEKDISLVSVADFTKLREKGGIAGVVDFMPIQQYVDTLQVMAQRKAEILNDIYEVTGVSDIMRGNSDPNETATAVTKKTNFGTLRNQDRQNDMQKFITDLLRIKADIICEMFADDTLVKFAGDEQDEETVLQAIQLLRAEKSRDMIFGIETDTAFEQDGTLEKITNAVTTVNEMVTKSFEVISAQPLLLPLYRQMVESVCATMPNARQFEPIIEKVFDNIQNELAQPQEEQPNIELEKIKVEREKMQLQAMETQATNAIKEKQLQLDLAKLQQESGKDYDDSFLKNKEIETQAQLKTAELIQKGNTDTNIGTGMVRSFE